MIPLHPPVGERRLPSAVTEFTDNQRETNPNSSVRRDSALNK